MGTVWQQTVPYFIRELDESLFCAIIRQLERLILEYEPTMLFVEHDVRFREKIATGKVELL